MPPTCSFLQQKTSSMWAGWQPGRGVDVLQYLCLDVVSLLGLPVSLLLLLSPSTSRPSQESGGKQRVGGSLSHVPFASVRDSSIPWIIPADQSQSIEC